jgi:hypothetical protein
MELFGVQHDEAKALCLHFGLNPDEMVIP